MACLQADSVSYPRWTWPRLIAEPRQSTAVTRNADASRSTSGRISARVEIELSAGSRTTERPLPAVSIPTVIFLSVHVQSMVPIVAMIEPELPAARGPLRPVPAVFGQDTAALDFDELAPLRISASVRKHLILRSVLRSNLHVDTRRSHNHASCRRGFGFGSGGRGECLRRW